MSDVEADKTERTPGSRDKLLDAALSAFGSKGFIGATTKEISVMAEVNEVTLFRHFESKAGLFEAVLKERFPRSQMAIELHFDRAAPVRKNLIENSHRLISIMNGNRDYVRIVQLDLPRFENREKEDPFSTAFVGPLTAYLSVVADQGAISSKDPEGAAALLYGVLLSYFVKNYIVVGRTTNPQADRSFIDMAVNVLLNGLMSGAVQDQGKPRSSRAR